MIRGYVSSDEEEDEDFYSDPPVKKKDMITFPHIQDVQIREKLHSALEHSKKVSLFLTAIDRNDLDTLEELISLGVSVDHSPAHEWTPLLRACSMGYVEVVEFLLEHNANPNLQKELFSPLMACCSSSYVGEELKLSCVRLLLQYNAKVNLKDRYKKTALMYATESGYKNIVDELLLVPDIDVNMQDKDGSTALFYAVENNNCDLVQKLINNGSDINLKDKNSRTALNVALLNGFLNVAKLLGYSEENEVVKLEKTSKNCSSKMVSDFSFNDEDMFSSDVESIFATWDEFVLKKKVSFPKFLNMTANDLIDVGVVFEYDRCKILKNIIHRYHLYPWKKSSMPEINNENIEIYDLVAITANIMKHLVIGSASIKYINSRTSRALPENMKDLSTVKELISVLLDIYSTSDQLKQLFIKILNQSNQIKICTEDDYIGPLKDNVLQKNKIKFKCILYTIGLTMASYFACRYWVK